MSQLGEIKGPELRSGERFHASVDLMPIGKTLGIKTGETRMRTGMRQPRELNVTRLIKRGFPKLANREVEAKGY